MDSVDPSSARKLQKAGREKQRRDRLNEQFIELGNTLDDDRPKNDKATMLNDTIQLLKDLTTEVDKLKAEHAALSEESHELTQEKNDLREEKGALKSEIEKLNTQCQQKVMPTSPWVSMHPSVLPPQPPSYPYHLPMQMPMHPSMQPYPFFGCPNPGMFSNPCSTFIPYMTPNAPCEQQSSQLVSLSLQSGAIGQVSGRQGLAMLSEQGKEKQIGKNKESCDVPANQDASSAGRNNRKSQEKKSVAAQSSSSSRCSSSNVQDNLSST